MKKPKRSRVARRAAVRRADKLTTDREKLARLEPGGSPERPIELQTASLVEPRAQSFACLRCDGPVRVASHEAEDFEGRPLRVVSTECKACGMARRLYFRITAPLLN